MVTFCHCILCDIWTRSQTLLECSLPPFRCLFALFSVLQMKSILLGPKPEPSSLQSLLFPLMPSSVLRASNSSPLKIALTPYESASFLSVGGFYISWLAGASKEPYHKWNSPPLTLKMSLLDTLRDISTSPTNLPEQTLNSAPSSSLSVLHPNPSEVLEAFSVFLSYVLHLGPVLH